MVSLNEIIKELEDLGISCISHGKSMSILVSRFRLLTEHEFGEDGTLYLTSADELQKMPRDKIRDSCIMAASVDATSLSNIAGRIIFADAPLAELCNILMRFFAAREALEKDASAGEYDNYSNCPQFCALVHSIIGENIRDRSLCMQKLAEISPSPYYGKVFRLIMISFREAPKGAAY